MDSDDGRKMYANGTQEIKGDKVELWRAAFLLLSCKMFPKTLTGESQHKAKNNEGTESNMRRLKLAENSFS